MNMNIETPQFEARYKKLNKAQKKAVDTIDGPLLVVAGPGSGKTEILSLRVAKILKESQVLPSNILCLTFTESAALNMRDRLSKLIGHEAYRVAIHTFHNFCVDIIQKYPEFFYKGAVFTPADPISQISILEDIFESLSYDNPFRVKHPEKGYIYLSDVSRAIGNIKKSGILPDEFVGIINHNKESVKIVNDILVPIFEKKIGKGTLDEVQGVLEVLKNEGKKMAEFPSALFRPLIETVVISLSEAVTLCEESGKNEPISKWKAKWFKQNDFGEKVFRDELHFEKMEALSDVYKRYRDEMHRRCMFDFDDMILDVITALETHPRLKFDMHEQYQYILVDEFQDTNNAQMRILNLLTDAEVNEGRPNIMVVGDDDQAVYKFQGAELSNILNFKSIFKDVEVVTMTSNYRSTQEILDVATHIIRKGEHRLENLLPEMEKTLISSNPELVKGNIHHKEFDTSLHEYHFVSRKIKELIDSGVNAEEIAIIARKHKQLEGIVPFMQGARVPIRYEREQNVFLEPHIEQIIYISRFINTLNAKDKEEADEYLPKIVSFPFWAIPRKTIWNISRLAFKERKTWLECMLEYSSDEEKVNKQVKDIAGFLIELGALSKAEPLEKVLDIIIGAHVQLIADSEDEEVIDSVLTHTDIEYTSPFKSYYFSKERFEHARAEYLSFLSSLRVFVKALREYKGKSGNNEILNIQDLIDFVDIHEKNDVKLNDESPFASARNAVNLLSSHKAKGLEFDTVFVLSCQDEVWAGKGMIKKISLPINLPLDPAGDTEDDQLRLFYVALTRAKRNLYLTSYRVKDDGAQSMKLRFLTPPENVDELLKHEALKKIYTPESIEGKTDENSSIFTPETHELLTASWLLYHTPPFLGEEEELLRSLLEGYQLSVTHLNNFLNVTKGGPQLFLEQNLLRFPQAKSPSGSYGSAVHKTLERISIQQKFNGTLPNKEEVIQWFKEYLSLERLSKSDARIYQERGIKALEAFYDEKKGEFAVEDKTEVNFKEQGVIVGDGDTPAHLTGKIDRIVIQPGGLMEVHDYKTGKAKSEWKPEGEYEKIKLYEYERQLIFYKILVEHSRDYGHQYKVKRGILEFVEPMSNGHIADLILDIDAEKVERVKKLISVVFTKIMNLDFPDVSTYSQDVEGIQAFEEDLLTEKV